MIAPRGPARRTQPPARATSSPALRTVPCRRRTIIGYRVVDGCVEVLRLVHGGQEWDEVEEDEG